MTYPRVAWTRMHDGSACFLQVAALRPPRNPHELRVPHEALVAAASLPSTFMSQRVCIHLPIVALL